MVKRPVPAAKSKITPTKTWRNLKRAAKTLKSPPSIARIAPSYHTTRRDCILGFLTKHYKTKSNNPVPLLNQTLLDIGCGTTPLGCMMALAGAEVTAIDPNPAALQAAATFADDFGTPLTFLRVKAETMLTSTQRFDVILMLDVLPEHPAPGKLLWVARQLLTPGGVLVVGHITRSWRAWLIHVVVSQLWLRRVPRLYRGWQHFHTPSQLNQLAEAAGLTPLTTHLLRYSLSGMHWKPSPNRHRATRYLSYFQAP